MVKWESGSVFGYFFSPGREGASGTLDKNSHIFLGSEREENSFLALHLVV